MYRVFFDDLEKAIVALRKVVKDELFCSVKGNYYGDFVFEIDEGDGYTYIVKHEDFSVWHNFGTWREPNWKEVK